MTPARAWNSSRSSRRVRRSESRQSFSITKLASSQRALTSAERATTLGPQERERRAAELADRRAEIERLGAASAASKGAA